MHAVAERQERQLSQRHVSVQCCVVGGGLCVYVCRYGVCISVVVVICVGLAFKRILDGCTVGLPLRDESY